MICYVWIFFPCYTHPSPSMDRDVFVSFAECLTSWWSYDRSKQNKHHKKHRDLSCRILYVTIIQTTRGIQELEPDSSEGDLHGKGCHSFIWKSCKRKIVICIFCDILMYPHELHTNLTNSCSFLILYRVGWRLLRFLSIFIEIFRSLNMQ